MPSAGLRIAQVELQAPSAVMDALAGCYRKDLGLPCEDRPDALKVGVGDAQLLFTSAGRGARPFYHFALLVPGDRFDAARAWIGRHAELLPGEDEGTVFDFAGWHAEACYFHDPAGNIVELIAHHSIGARPELRGGFEAMELIGISELGIVVDNPARAADLLHRHLGLVMWSGAVDETGGLGFVGRQAHTLILAGPGRGWLPTGRPAELHPVAVTITGEWQGADESVILAAEPHRIRVSRAHRQATRGTWR